MTSQSRYDPDGIEIRGDLEAAIERAWTHLATAGTWWSGQQRLAMVAEARNVAACDLCARRKAALSPYTIDGEHDAGTDLPEVVVEVIHRLKTDASRLTERWLHHVLARGLTDAEYVEIVGVVATITALDSFSRALGRPIPQVPAAIIGEPSRHRPSNARRQIAWVPTVLPGELTAEDGDPFRFGGVHIQQAMSLVPASVEGFFDLDSVLYLVQDHIRDFETEHRAITHAQIELIAAKASYMNACFY